MNRNYVPVILCVASLVLSLFGFPITAGLVACNYLADPHIPFYVLAIGVLLGAVGIAIGKPDEVSSANYDPHEYEIRKLLGNHFQKLEDLKKELPDVPYLDLLKNVLDFAHERREEFKCYVQAKEVFG